MNDEEKKKLVEKVIITKDVQVEFIPSDDQVEALEAVVEGKLVNALEELIVDNTPGPIHGAMAIAITMATIVSKYMSSGNPEAAAHNIDQLCRVAKDLSRKLCKSKGSTGESPPESHVLN